VTSLNRLASRPGVDREHAPTYLWHPKGRFDGYWGGRTEPPAAPDRDALVLCRAREASHGRDLAHEFCRRAGSPGTKGASSTTALRARSNRRLSWRLPHHTRSQRVSTTARTNKARTPPAIVRGEIPAVRLLRAWRGPTLASLSTRARPRRRRFVVPGINLDHLRQHSTGFRARPALSIRQNTDRWGGTGKGG